MFDNWLRMLAFTLVLGCFFEIEVASAEDWVSRHGVQLHANTELSQEARSLISDETKGVQVVGLGETSHGISQIFQTKSQLIKFLVSEEQFSLIMIEATFEEVVFLNEYISGQRDDIDEILKGMPLWYFKVHEFRELLEWLRAFNATHENPVQLFGMEMQYVDRSLLQIKKYLDKVNPTANLLWENFGTDRIGGATETAKDFFHLWQPMPDQTLREHVDLLFQLRKTLRENRNEFVSKTNAAEYHLAVRHLVVLEQFVAAKLQSEESIKHQMRDYFMFLNVQWTMAHLGNPKTIIWAHNEHIWKQAGNGGYDVLGRQLERAYGQSYFAIGFDFGSGTYRAPGADGWLHEVPKPQEDSLTHRMSHAGDANFILNLRSALRASEPIPATVTLRASSGGYTPTKGGETLYDRQYSLCDRYDALIFLNRASPPAMLE